MRPVGLARHSSHIGTSGTGSGGAEPPWEPLLVHPCLGCLPKHGMAPLAHARPPRSLPPACLPASSCATSCTTGATRRRPPSCAPCEPPSPPAPTREPPCSSRQAPQAEGSGQPPGGAATHSRAVLHAGEQVPLRDVLFVRQRLPRLQNKAGRCAWVARPHAGCRAALKGAAQPAGSRAGPAGEPPATAAGRDCIHRAPRSGWLAARWPAMPSWRPLGSLQSIICRNA